jgi:hypothetical protein
MEGKNPRPILKILAGYYGILQSFHILFLARAGWIYLQSGRMPFPASPPLEGWSDTTIDFMIGMGAADAVAAGLGILFVYSLLIKQVEKPIVGLVSLTIALTSGVVYLAGTLPSGAWGDHPLSYLIVILAFAPVVPFFLVFLARTSKARS